MKEAAPSLPDVVDGYFTLPSGPDLGVTPNPDVIRAHPHRPLHFNLFSEDRHQRQHL